VSEPDEAVNAAGRPIVLDKSFLIGASGEQLRALGRDYTVVVSDALVLEILTTSAVDRCRCGQRLNELVRRFKIVESIPAMLRFEIANQAPVTPVFENVTNVDARIGRRLYQHKLVLTAREVCKIQTWRADVAAAVEGFLAESETIPKLFPALESSKEHERRAEALSLQQRLVDDPQPIFELHRAMNNPRFPAADLINENWAFFRRLQVHFFATLDEYGKQGKDVASKPRSQKSKKELENEVVDFDYRILGLLVGGLATLDSTCARTFRALAPTGLLLEKSWTPALPPIESVTQ
jgi:hypothetical protein